MLQVVGSWRVKQPHLEPLRDEARELCKKIGAYKVSLCHIPREQNSAADALANRAMDTRKTTRTMGKKTLLDDEGDSDTDEVVIVEKPNSSGGGAGKRERVEVEDEWEESKRLREDTP